jgi:hypothetical protein
MTNAFELFSDAFSGFPGAAYDKNCLMCLIGWFH